MLARVAALLRCQRAVPLAERVRISAPPPTGHLGFPARFHPSRPLFSTPDPAASPAHPLREAPSIFPRRSHSLAPTYPFWGSPPASGFLSSAFSSRVLVSAQRGVPQECRQSTPGSARLHPQFPHPRSSGRGPDPSALQVRAPRLPTVAIPIRPLALGVGVQRVPNIGALTLRPGLGFLNIAIPNAPPGSGSGAPLSRDPDTSAPRTRAPGSPRTQS